MSEDLESEVAREVRADERLHGRLVRLKNNGVRFYDQSSGCLLIFSGFGGFCLTIFSALAAGFPWRFPAFTGAASVLMVGFGLGYRRAIDATPAGLTIQRRLYGWPLTRRFVPRAEIHLRVDRLGTDQTGVTRYKIWYGSGLRDVLPGSASREKMTALKAVLEEALNGASSRR